MLPAGVDDDCYRSPPRNSNREMKSDSQGLRSSDFFLPVGAPPRQAAGQRRPDDLPIGVIESEHSDRRSRPDLDVSRPIPVAQEPTLLGRRLHRGNGGFRTWIDETFGSKSTAVGADGRSKF